MGNVVKISGYLYCTTIALGKVTNKKNQIFIIPVALLTTIAVVLIKDNRPVIAVPEPIQQIFHRLSLISIMIIPSIILIVYFFRRKNIKHTND